MSKLFKSVEKLIVEKLIDSMLNTNNPHVLLYGFAGNKRRQDQVKVYDYMKEVIKNSRQESFAQQIMAHLCSKHLDQLLINTLRIGMYKQDMLGLKNDFVISKPVYDYLCKERQFKKNTWTEAPELFSYLNFVGYYGNCRLVMNSFWEDVVEPVMVSVPNTGLLNFSLTDVMYEGGDKASVILEVGTGRHEVYKLMTSEST